MGKDKDNVEHVSFDRERCICPKCGANHIKKKVR